MESATKDLAAATARRRKAKKAYLILGIVAGIAAGAWFLHRWWTAGRQTTDDAQVEADVVPVAPRVGGVVKLAHVHDNQRVKQGDLLLELDPIDLDVEVARAEAELEAARAQLAASQAQVAIVKSSSSGGLVSARAAVSGAGAAVRGAGDAVRGADAAVARARADLGSATTELGRAQQLFGSGAITRRDLEQAQQVYDVAKAAHDAATAQLDAARSQRGLAHARVAEAEGRVTQSAPEQQISAAEASAQLGAARVKVAEVAVSRAKLNRSYARVVAPTDGVISKLGVHAGQSVLANQTVLMVVPTETYVIANFKENQIAAMRPGNPVDISLDAYGGTYRGVIETISPATGARFSLIPPDNATGNFVKVVQRVPVKISWSVPPDIPVRPGLSAEVTVHVE